MQLVYDVKRTNQFVFSIEGNSASLRDSTVADKGKNKTTTLNGGRVNS
jgi:hypothetical protein